MGLEIRDPGMQGDDQGQDSGEWGNSGDEYRRSDPGSPEYDPAVELGGGRNSIEIEDPGIQQQHEDNDLRGDPRAESDSELIKAGAQLIVTPEQIAAAESEMHGDIFAQLKAARETIEYLTGDNAALQRENERLRTDGAARDALIADIKVMLDEFAQQ